MHSLRGWNWLALGGLVGSVQSAAVPAPAITPAPEPGVEAWVRRQEPNAASFAKVLLTAIPLSLRQIAVTNAPAVSSILWEEFLDDKKPQWFLNLPWDIQSYLISEFGPETAWPYPTRQTSVVQTTPTNSVSQSLRSTATRRSSRPTPSASTSARRSTRQSSAASTASSATIIVSSILTRSSSTRSSATLSNSQSTTSSSFESTSTSASALSSSASASSPSSTQSTPTPTPSLSEATDPDSPPASNEGLTKRQKIALGVGIAFGILGAAALLLGCCFLCRRRRNRKHVDGLEPPSSPGFIPRFAFQDRSSDQFDHRTLLNYTHNQSRGDLGTMNWEDDGYDPYEPTNTFPRSMDASNRNISPPSPATPMAMHNAQPIMAPALHHTHSSNRARGKRTSYTSLHSVAELSEPDEMESPVLGRQTTPLQRKRRPSLPMVLEMPSTPRAATVKRKPVPQSPTGISPAAEAASQSLLRPAMRHVDHSGSSSSGLALSSDSSQGASYHGDPPSRSPVSPLSQNAPANPFSNDNSYVEDYGPEYQSGYVDHEDGLYGGHRSLNRYPDPSPPGRGSLKTEWPLRNLSIGKRNRSPMWDRVYEG